MPSPRPSVLVLDTAPPASSEEAHAPLLKAYGDDDDHLRLSVLIAESFSRFDGEASQICLRPKTPWTARLEAIEQMLSMMSSSNRSLLLPEGSRAGFALVVRSVSESSARYSTSPTIRRRSFYRKPVRPSPRALLAPLNASLCCGRRSSSTDG